MNSSPFVVVAAFFCFFIGADGQTMTAKPLNMDIEWVMQGFEFGFQGFMVEFLGYSSAIRKILPQTRLVQSSFRKSFDDIPVQNASLFFDEQMFPREGNDSKWLYSKEQPQVPTPGTPKGSLLSTSFADPSTYIKDTRYRNR